MAERCRCLRLASVPAWWTGTPCLCRELGSRGAVVSPVCLDALQDKGDVFKPLWQNLLELLCQSLELKGAFSHVVVPEEMIRNNWLSLICSEVPVFATPRFKQFHPPATPRVPINQARHLAYRESFAGGTCVSELRQGNGEQCSHC